VKKISEILGRDPDELLALAGRVATDLTDIIRQRPGRWQTSCGPRKGSLPKIWPGSRGRRRRRRRSNARPVAITFRDDAFEVDK
jgi:hypothetical protein